MNARSGHSAATKIEVKNAESGHSGVTTIEAKFRTQYCNWCPHTGEPSRQCNTCKREMTNIGKYPLLPNDLIFFTKHKTTKPKNRKKRRFATFNFCLFRRFVFDNFVFNYTHAVWAYAASRPRAFVTVCWRHRAPQASPRLVGTLLAEVFV